MNIRKTSLIYVVAIAYFALSFSLTYTRWKSHSPSLDYHAYVQMYWNTANGDTLMYNRGSENQYSLYKAHFSPFLLMIFPIYALVQHPLTLYFVFFAVISTSVIPLYFFALDKLQSKLSAWLIALSFLIYFPFAFTHRQGFAEEAFATPLLLWAFYLLHKQKPWAFLAFSFLTLSLRINMVIPVFMLALYAIAKSKYKVHGLFVALLSLFWLFYTLYIIYPNFNLPSERLYIAGFFSDYGNTAGEIAKNVILHPLSVVEKITAPEKLNYMRWLVGPVLFLPVLAPEILIIGVPVLVLNMLSSYPRMSHLWTYYHSSSLPFIWLATVVALERIGRIKIGRKVIVNALLAAIFIVNFLIVKNTPNGQHFPFSNWFNRSTHEVTARDKAADEILTNIPTIYSVASNYGFLENTAQRKWQFPVANFKGYLVDLVLYDPLALTGEALEIPDTDKEYGRLFTNNLFFLFARRDLIKKYSIGDFITREFKNYDQNAAYLAASNPSEKLPTYSGMTTTRVVDINNIYNLVQKLDFANGNPAVLQFPVEKTELVRRVKILGVDFLLPKRGTGALKAEILEGGDFEKNYKIVYSKVEERNELAHKPSILSIDLSKLQIDASRTYWLKLSMETNTSGGVSLFNSYKVYLTKNDESDLRYSLDGGKAWSGNNYPKQSLIYSIAYDSVKDTILTKGTPQQLKQQLQEMTKTSQDYKDVVVVGAVTEKL